MNPYLNIDLGIPFMARVYNIWILVGTYPFWDTYSEEPVVTAIVSGAKWLSTRHFTNGTVTIYVDNIPMFSRIIARNIENNSGIISFDTIGYDTEYLHPLGEQFKVLYEAIMPQTWFQFEETAVKGWVTEVSPNILREIILRGPTTSFIGPPEFSNASFKVGYGLFQGNPVFAVETDQYRNVVFDDPLSAANAVYEVWVINAGTKYKLQKGIPLEDKSSPTSFWNQLGGRPRNEWVNNFAIKLTEEIAKLKAANEPLS